MSILIPNTSTLGSPAATLLPIPRTVLDLITPHGGKPRHVITVDNAHQDELLDILATHHHAAHEHNVLAASNNPQNRAAVAQLREKIDGLVDRARDVTRKITSAQDPQIAGQPTAVQQLIQKHPRVDNPQQEGYEQQPLQTAGPNTTGVTTQFGPISLPCAIVPCTTTAGPGIRHPGTPPANSHATVGFSGSLSIPLGVIPLNALNQQATPDDVPRAAAYASRFEGQPLTPQLLDFLQRSFPRVRFDQETGYRCHTEEFRVGAVRLCTNARGTLQTVVAH